MNEDDDRIERAEERMAIYQNNPRLFDSTQHFALSFERLIYDEEGDFEVPTEVCQRTLAFFMPRLRRLQSFMTEAHGSEELHWISTWNEVTRRAISSCIANNPGLQKFEARGWVGPVCFLKALPASLNSLILKYTSIDNDSSVPSLDSRLRLRPRVLHLEPDWGAIPPFILKEGGTVLSQLHTLKMQMGSPKDVRVILGVVPQSLRCLSIRYWRHSSDELEQIGQELLSSQIPPVSGTARIGRCSHSRQPYASFPHPPHGLYGANVDCALHLRVLPDTKADYRDDVGRGAREESGRQEPFLGVQ
ncbi:hypothetical protein BKA70DRAFT_527973 [Coprinopsis sp. MPI-PUGE-AT-0042]|nr:hypothetical protein BKA70DRAFT_527973 [Coprinopsis sp. MPI-PUGE-AT-0042]